MIEGATGYFIDFNRPKYNRNNEEREPPKIIDPKNRVVPSNVGIGNGTVIRARGLVKTQNAEGKEMSPTQAMEKYNGYGLFLVDAMVLDLVEYSGGADFVEDEGSFSVDALEGGIVDDDIPFLTS